MKSKSQIWTQQVQLPMCQNLENLSFEVVLFLGMSPPKLLDLMWPVVGYIRPRSKMCE